MEVSVRYLESKEETGKGQGSIHVAPKDRSA